MIDALLALLICGATVGVIYLYLYILIGKY